MFILIKQIDQRYIKIDHIYGNNCLARSKLLNIKIK